MYGVRVCSNFDLHADVHGVAESDTTERVLCVCVCVYVYNLFKVKEESEKSWLKSQHSENEDHGIWSHHFMGNRWGNSG